jgi:hypothetical protein
MNVPNPPMSVYGFADASPDFDRRHPQWSAVMSRLWDAMNLALSRTLVMDTKIEEFVYFYGNLVAEDFMELFLMAVNGYGYGAPSKLRLGGSLDFGWSRASALQLKLGQVAASALN